MDYHNLKIVSCLLFILIGVGIRIRFSFRAIDILDFQSDKCPFCLSHSLCSEIKDLHIEISILDAVIGLFNRKYVLYGILGNRSVAIKRLVRNEEIVALEAEISNIFNNPAHISMRSFFDRSLLLLNRSFEDPSYKLRLCPSLENAPILFNSLTERNNLVNIWTALRLSPEPLLLQILPRADGWPVPEYIGSCGRIMIVEHCGETIENYLNHPLLFRVHIIEQLLLMAYNFTFSDPRFSFYFRDISYSNVVLDVNMKTRMVDLEHVVIVDKNISVENQPATWYKVHQSENYYCEDCLIYSPQKICSHRFSDHNFYAVCKEFLHSIYPKDLGLLHSLVDSDYPATIVERLRHYATECIHPSGNNTRFGIVEKIIKLTNELKIFGNFTVDAWREII